MKILIETLRTVIAEMREFYDKAVTVDDDQFLSWIDRLEPLINTQRVEHETPVAWAHITDDGRIRMWGYTCNDADLQRLAEQIGTQPVPLYTHPASTGKESLPVASAIDLEQFRERIAAVLQDEFDLEAADPEDLRHEDGRSEALRIADRLLALIDGQAAGLVRACERDQSPAPARIWLQIDTNGEPTDPMPPQWNELAEVSWCGHSIGGLEVEYVRADLAHVQPTKGEGVADGQ